MSRVAVSVSLYMDASRGEEYEALLKLATLGFDKVLEDCESDERVYCVEGEYLVGVELDHSTTDSLESSLQEAGYRVVDVFKYLEEKGR